MKPAAAGRWCSRSRWPRSASASRPAVTTARTAPAAAAQRWDTLARSTIARTEVAAARIGDGAYVVGGFAPPDGATSDVVERYDLRLDRWARVEADPAGRQPRGGGRLRRRPLRRRRLHRRQRAGRRDRRAVALRARRRPLDAAARRAVGARRARGRGDRRPALRRGRGARRRGAAHAGDLRLQAPALVARAVAAHRPRAPRGAVHGGAFYVIAGRANGLNNFRVVERYVPAKRRWERVPSLRKARGGIAAATVNGRVVVVGGEESAGTIAEVESYDPRTRRWRAEPRLKTPRHGLGAVALPRPDRRARGRPGARLDLLRRDRGAADRWLRLPSRSAAGRRPTRSTSPTTTRSGAGRCATSTACSSGCASRRFQSGLAWITILRKRENFRAAFARLRSRGDRALRRRRRRSG